MLTSESNAASWSTTGLPEPTRHGRGKHNDVLSYALLFVLALSPLPLGSNRPFFWGVAGVLVGSIGAIYFFHLQRRAIELRVRFSAIPLQVSAAAALLVFLSIQALPIAAPLGLETIASFGDTALKSHSISYASGPTWLMLLRFGTYCLFGFLMLQVSGRGSRVTFMLDGILAITVVYSLIGLVSLQAGDTYLGLPKWAYPGAATGTFVNRNSFATFLAFGVCISAAKVSSAFVSAPSGQGGLKTHSSITLKSLFYASMYVLLLTTVVATQSRMGLLVSAAGTVVAVFLSLGARTRPSTMLLIVGLVVTTVVIGSVLAVLGSGVIDRLGGVERSASTRFRLYDQVYGIIWNRPITGTGGGTFEVAFPLFHQLPVNPDVVWDKAHNTYLALWTELGVVFGSIPMVMVMLVSVQLCLSIAKGRGNREIQATAFAVTVVGALHSLVDFSLEIQANTLIFVALLSLGLGSSIKSPRRSTGP